MGGGGEIGPWVYRLNIYACPHVKFSYSEKAQNFEKSPNCCDFTKYVLMSKFEFCILLRISELYKQKTRGGIGGHKYCQFWDTAVYEQALDH